MGEKSRALPAAEVAYRDEISLENYRRVAEIAGEHWPERRTALLEYTRSKITAYPKGQVDVLVSEGLVGDAIAMLDPYASHTLVEQVVDAALEAQSHLEWAIEACRKQAEYIMDGGKAQLYAAAVNWRFHLSYMRYTGQWIQLYTDLTVDECIEAIRDEPYFFP